MYLFILLSNKLNITFNGEYTGRQNHGKEKLVWNEGFKIHSSLVPIHGAQQADMTLHQKHL